MLFSGLVEGASARACRTTIVTINRVGFYGGVERTVLRCASAARRAGYRPFIACPPPDRGSDAGGLAAHAQRLGIETSGISVDRTKISLSPRRLGRAAVSYAHGRGEILRLAQREHAAVLHVHHPVGALYAHVAAVRLDVPLLMHVHESLPARPAYVAALRVAQRYCAHFICVSRASVDLLDRVGVSRTRVSLIYNAVDPDFAEPVRPSPDVAGPGPHVGVFGVLEPRKGHADLLRAVALLREPHPRLTLWIVGGASYAEGGGYVSGLRDLATELGIADRVRFLGHRSDVPGLMQAMDAVVLSSTGFESLPTALLEASTLGRRMLATDVGGTREIVRDGETGLIVPPRDAAALAQGLGRLLGAEGAALADRARADARLRFSQVRFDTEMAQAYAALIENVSAGSHRS